MNLFISFLLIRRGLKKRGIEIWILYTSRTVCSCRWLDPFFFPITATLISVVPFIPYFLPLELFLSNFWQPFCFSTNQYQSIPSLRFLPISLFYPLSTFHQLSPNNLHRGISTISTKTNRWKFDKLECWSIYIRGIFHSLLCLRFL